MCACVCGGEGRAARGRLPPGYMGLCRGGAGIYDRDGRIYNDRRGGKLLSHCDLVGVMSGRPAQRRVFSLLPTLLHGEWWDYVFVCYSTCYQHLRSYQQLVTVRTHGNFIVLSLWKTRLPAP